MSYFSDFWVKCSLLSDKNLLFSAKESLETLNAVLKTFRWLVLTDSNRGRL
jgi:hypothetical protein